MHPKRRYILLIVYILPFIAGLFGFLFQEKIPLSDAAFFSLTLYFLGYTEHTGSFWVALARWFAPLMTASWVVAAFAAAREWMRIQVARLRGNSIAVYGAEDDLDRVMREPQCPSFRGGRRFVNAEKYLLLGGEAENIRFIREHRDELRDKVVYMRADTLKSLDEVGGDIRIFSYEETAARTYWKEYAPAKEQHLKFVLIGFNRLTENLIIAGLLVNLYSAGQKFEYHVIGRTGDFCRVYHEMDKISDPVICHEGAWYDHADVIENADRIIICEQENQTALVRRLLLAFPGRHMDVCAAPDFFWQYPEAQKRLRIFSWKEKGGSADSILRGSLYEQAKRLNLHYAHIYKHNVPETEEEKEKQWREIDSFTRYSNVSSADYQAVLLNVIEDRGWDKNNLTGAQLDELSELEHIRWCRYHYLNNWRYGEPANGKNKDSFQCIHRDLLPYGKLPQGEREKDRESIRTFLQIDLS